MNRPRSRRSGRVFPRPDKLIQPPLDVTNRTLPLTSAQLFRSELGKVAIREFVVSPAVAHAAAPLAHNRRLHTHTHTQTTYTRGHFVCKFSFVGELIFSNEMCENRDKNKMT